MPTQTYYTKPQAVAVWQVSGEELAANLTAKEALPLDLELAAYRFIAAKDETPAKLQHYRFTQLRKRFEEGDFIVRDEAGRFTVWNEKDFTAKYIPMSNPAAVSVA